MHTNNNLSRVYTAMATAFLIIAITFSYYLMRYGINFTDEPYYMVYAKDYKTEPMFALTSLCHGLWGKLFGEKWLAYRALATTLFNLSIIIPSIYYYYRNRNLIKSITSCAVLILLLALSSGGWYGFIGVDSFSMCSASIFAVCALEYLRRPTTLKVVVMAIVGATITWFRLPNVVNVVIAISAITYINCIERKSLKAFITSMSVYLLVLIAVFWLFVVVLYGDFAEYSHFSELNNRHNQLDSYAFLVTTPLYHTFVQIVPALALILLYAFMTNLSFSIKKNKVRVITLAFVIAFAVGETLLLWRLLFLNKHVLYVSALWFFVGYGLVQSYQQGKNPMPLLIIFLCSFIAAAGSNNGLLKSTTFSLFPFIMIYVKPEKLFRVIAWVVAMCIFTVNVFALHNVLYSDGKLVNLKSVVQNPKLKGVYTTEWRAKYIKEAITDFESCRYEGCRPMVIGNTIDRYTFEYLLDCKNNILGNPFSGQDFYSDPSYVNAVDAEIRQSEKPIVVLFFTDNSNDSPSMMEQIVAPHFSNSLKKPKYTIYY